MKRALALLLVGVLACGRGGAGGEDESQGTAPGAGGGDQVQAEAVEGVETAEGGGSDQRLAEFQPLSAADVELYLKVMRTAAGRLQNLSAADRQAYRVFRELTTHPPAAGQMLTAEQLAAIERGGQLMVMDGNVAKELGVSGRYSSIQHRVDRYLMPMEGSSGEEVSAEERARVAERIRRFQELDRADAALLAPHRAEIEALRNQVQLALHPDNLE